VRGLDEGERAVYALLRNDQDLPPDHDFRAVLDRLVMRRLVIFGPLCMHCGLHPEIIITSLGNQVEEYDRMARDGSLPS